MSCPNSQKLHWLEAIQKSKNIDDPWEKYDIIGMLPKQRFKIFLNFLKNFMDNNIMGFNDALNF